jgi:chromosome segregation ATPase
MDEGAVSPQFDAFARHLAGLIQETSRQENERMFMRLRDHFDRRMDELQERIDRKIEHLREEIRGEIEKVKSVQEMQSGKLQRHGEALARVEQRLEHGDARFQEVDARLKAVETAGQDNRVTLAGLAASIGRIAIPSAVSGATVVGILKMLGG